MATQRVLVDLAAAAAYAGLPQLEIESVGGVDAEQRVAAGESFDLVFLASDALTRLARGGQVISASVSPLLLSPVAIAVPSNSNESAVRPGGAAFPDAAGVREALRSAGSIGVSTGPSGTALVRAIEEWGMTDDLGDRLIQAPPGIPVARFIAEGKVDLGFQQLSELVGQPRVRILGVLPADCAIDTVFAGAVAKESSEPDAARDVLAFFTSDQVAPIKSAHNFGTG